MREIQLPQSHFEMTEPGTRKLENAPLVHSMVALTFSELPTTKLTSEKLREIHKELAGLGFSEKIETTIQIQEWNLTAEESSGHTHSVPRYSFRNKDQTALVDLSLAGPIGLRIKHTAYPGFKHINQMLIKILEVLGDNIDLFCNAVVKEIGFRNTNVFTPYGGDVEELLCEPDLLPPTLDFIEHTGRRVAITQCFYQTSDESFLSVSAERVQPDDEKRAVAKVIPEDLGESNPDVLLRIPWKDEWNDITSSYAIIDINHLAYPKGWVLGDITQLAQRTAELHDQTNNVFWKVISQKAKSVWGAYVEN